MAYDTTKLTRLAHLKSLAQKVATECATKTELNALSDRVDDLVTAGGEPNVLTGVKVNGAALTIAEKMVDILIATGVANGTIKVNGADVAVKGLAALAYKAQVSEADLDTALKAVLDAKATEADLAALENLVGTIPAGSASTTIVDYVAEKVAAIVAGADASLDTLKEIADWINGHASDAAEMNSDIATNTSNIAALTTLVGTLPEEAVSTNVVAYIAEAIAAIGIGDYVKTTEMNTALEGYVQKVDGKGLSTNDYTNADKEKLAGIAAGATKVEASTVNGKVKVNGADITVYTEPSDVVHGAIATDTEVTEMLNEVFATE